jgi:hypothetical protein
MYCSRLAILLRRRWELQVWIPFPEHLSYIPLAGADSGTVLLKGMPESILKMFWLLWVFLKDVLADCDNGKVVVQANGGRILDQMGLYERLAEEGKMAKMVQNSIRRSDGRVVSVSTWPSLMEQR